MKKLLLLTMLLSLFVSKVAKAADEYQPHWADVGPYISVMGNPDNNSGDERLALGGRVLVFLHEQDFAVGPDFALSDADYGTLQMSLPLRWWPSEDHKDALKPIITFDAFTYETGLEEKPTDSLFKLDPTATVGVQIVLNPATLEFEGGVRYNWLVDGKQDDGDLTLVLKMAINGWLGAR